MKKNTIIYAECILTMPTLREHRIVKCHLYLLEFWLDISPLNFLNILIVWKTNNYMFHLLYGAAFVFFKRCNDNENEPTINGLRNGTTK